MRIPSFFSTQRTLFFLLCLSVSGSAAAATTGFMALAAIHGTPGFPLKASLAVAFLGLSIASVIFAVPRLRQFVHTARTSAMHQARFNAAGQATSDALILLEPVVVDDTIVDFTMTYANEKACTLFKLPAQNLVGERLCERLPVFRNERLFEQYRSIAISGKSSTTEFSLRDPSIDAMWLRSSVVRFEHGLILSITNLTAQKDFESRLCHAAHHDPLTGLPNRALLDDRMQQAIMRARRNHNTAAVLILDLDGFKDINEQYGHAAGDFVLKNVAGRLRNAVRSSDSVFRLGGDEFVIVFGDLANKRQVADFARKIVLSLLPPLPCQHNSFDISASIGVAIYPDDGSTPESMLVQADMQMYRMKRSHQVKANAIVSAPDFQHMLLEVS